MAVRAVAQFSGLTNIFFQVNRPNTVADSGNKRKFARFDAFTSEQHNASIDMTEFPIEDGRFISDHIIVKPRELEITAVATDTPIQLYGGIGSAIDFATNIVTGNFRDPLAGVATKARREWESLNRILGSGNTLTITTMLEVYTNMVLVSMSAVSDNTTGKDLMVSMSFKETLVIDSGTVDFLGISKLLGINNKMSIANKGAGSLAPVSNEEAAIIGRTL